MPNFGNKDMCPILSDSMKDIVNRSTGDKLENTMFDNIVYYKKKIMDALNSNDDIKNILISNISVVDDLRDILIFDYLKLPELQSEVKNYICYDISSNSFNEDITYTITLRCVCYKDNIKTDWGISRHDLLSLAVKKILDWSNELGLTLNKKNDLYGYTDNGFYYRELVYNITSKTNNIHNKLYYGNK